MLFELFAPQGLKCPAAAVQRVDFGEIGKFAQQITKINFTGGHTCIFRHLNPNPDKPEIPKNRMPKVPKLPKIVVSLRSVLNYNIWYFQHAKPEIS